MPSAAQRNAAKAKMKKEDERKKNPGRPATKKQVQIFNSASDLLIEGCYQKYHEMYLMRGPFQWELSFPIIQTAGAPWTKEKVKCGMVLMELAEKAKKCLNKAIAAYLLEKNGAETEALRSQLNNLILDANIPDGKLLPCTCDFLELIPDYASKGDHKGVENIHVMKDGCQRVVAGDLWHFFVNYKTLFAAFLYISMTLHFKSAYHQIMDLMKEVPPGLEKAKVSDPEDDLPLVERMAKLLKDFNEE